MNSSEAIVIALIVVVIVALAARARMPGGGDGMPCEGEGCGGGMMMGGDMMGGGSGDGGDFYSRMAAERAAENARIASRVGVRNDGAGWGAQRQPDPADAVQSRNGVWMSPGRLAAAEQQAWAPYTGTAAPHYDVKKGTYPGSDLTQQLGNYQEGDWTQQVTDLALDPRTRAQHAQWVNEVGPFSQGAFSVDNLDEAVAMSQHRVGIRAFQALTPPQSNCTLQVTERDADLNAAHFHPAYF